ncbi:MAG: glycosyltransferase family 4 protein [Clostridia bacterium]
MKKFTLFLSNISNDLLTKDVGIIPFIMQKYYGYKSSIISLKTENEIFDNKKYLEGLEVQILKSNEQLNEELKKTDVLMLIGIYDFNISISSLYKSLNPSGKIYLKLDANLYWMQSIDKTMNQQTFNFLKSCYKISVESRSLQNILNSMWNLDIQFSTNGYYDFIDDKIIEYEDKKNIILFVGRVGAPEKNNQLLLEAFKNIEDKIKDWKLEFAGPVDDNFLIYLNKYFIENEHLRSRIVLSGKHDKNGLKKVYKDAKVFCLTSYSEACANVFSESVSNGCYLVSSDVNSVIDIIDYGRYGAIFPINNIDKLSQTLLEVCTNDDLLRKNCKVSQIYARDNLHWINICGEINKMLI